MSDARIPRRGASVVATPAAGTPAAREPSPLDAPMTGVERAAWERERVGIHRRSVALFVGAAWGVDLAARAIGALAGLGPSAGIADALGRSLVELVIGGGISAIALPGLMEARARAKWLRERRLREALLE